MNFLALQLCRRSRYCAYHSTTTMTAVNNIVKRRYQVAGNEERLSQPVKSKLFPDYNVVYKLPYVTFTYTLSRLKRNSTVATGVAVPTSLTMNLLDFMTLDDCLSVIVACCMITIPLHASGYLCNDVIGSMCVKDKKKIVISYINYWGTRVDLETDATNVEPLSENATNRSKLGQFKYLRIKSPKKKLKLYVTHGQILDKSEFSNIVGDYE